MPLMVKLKVYVQMYNKAAMLWQKISIHSITPSLKTFKKTAFQRLKITHYPSIIWSNNSV